MMEGRSELHTIMNENRRKKSFQNKKKSGGGPIFHFSYSKQLLNPELSQRLYSKFAGWIQTFLDEQFDKVMQLHTFDS